MESGSSSFPLEYRMKPKEHFLFLVLWMIFKSSAALAEERAFQVVGQTGALHFQKGHLEFANLKPDDAPKTNLFGQYKGTEEETLAKAVFQDTDVTEVLITGKDSTARLLFKDDSIVDLGPETFLQVSQFELSPTFRNVTLRCLRGKLRILVTRKFEGKSTYRVETPGTTTWVRGTDFAVHAVTPEVAGKAPSQTFVLGIRGQVTTDLSRLTNDGRIFLQTLIINTYSLLSATSANGFILRQELSDHLEGKDYELAYAEHAVFSDIQALPLGHPVNIADLPGTGVGTQTEKTATMPNHGLSHEGDALDQEHPLPLAFQKVRTSQSDNFTVPSDLDTHPWHRRIVEDFWFPVSSIIVGPRLLPYAQQNIHSPGWIGK